MNFFNMRLGKKKAKHDPRTLQMANYLQLPKIPNARAWASKLSKPLGVMKNDSLGDCTCAAMGHAVQTWTANASKEVTPSDNDIVAAYSAVGGYVPGNPGTDNGAVELDVLNYWRKTGLSGKKIAAYVATEPQNLVHVKAAIELFGGCYIGLALPISAQSQKVWSVPSGGLHGNGTPGSWGGHAVWVLAYDTHTLTCITWGKLQKMTWQFWGNFCDEAYGILSPDWIKKSGKSPSGFDINQLMTDLNLIR